MYCETYQLLTRQRPPIAPLVYNDGTRRVDQPNDIITRSTGLGAILDDEELSYVVEHRSLAERVRYNRDPSLRTPSSLASIERLQRWEERMYDRITKKLHRLCAARTNFDRLLDRPEVRRSPVYVYATHKIDVLERILAAARVPDHIGTPEESRRIICAVNTIMDSLVPLFLDLERRRPWTDDMLITTPSCDRVLEYGRLPDISDIICQINYWRDVEDHIIPVKAERKKPAGRTGGALVASAADASAFSAASAAAVANQQHDISQYLQAPKNLKNKPSYILSKILKKGLPRRCVVRNLVPIIIKSISADVTLADFFKTIFMCTVLGVYPHCRHTPPFYVRYKVYSMLRYPLLKDDADMTIKRFITQSHTSQPTGTTNGAPTVVFDNQETICYMLREFLIFHIGLIPALGEVLDNTIQFDATRQTVVERCEMMRKRISENYMCRQNFFHGVEDMLLEEKRPRTDNIYSVRGPSFVEALLEKCRLININRLYDRAVPPDDEIMARTYENVVHYLLRFASVMIQGTRDDHDAPQIRLVPEVPRNWQHLLEMLLEGRFPSVLAGVSPSCAAKLDQARQAFEVDGKLTHVHRAVNEDIPDHRQYQFVQAFYRCLDIVQGIRVYKQPPHYVDRTIQALRERYNVDPTEPLTDEVINYLREKSALYYCTNCKTVKSRVVQSIFTRNAHALGVDCTIDTDTHVLYCAGKGRSMPGSKKNDPNAHDPVALALLQQDTDGTSNSNLTAKAFKKIAKKRMKLAANKRCTETPLIYLDMLGNFVQIFDEIYLLCPACGVLTNYDQRRPAFDIYTCGYCRTETIGQSKAASICCNFCDKVRTDRSTAWGTYVAQHTRDPEGDAERDKKSIRLWTATSDLLKKIAAQDQELGKHSLDAVANGRVVMPQGASSSHYSLLQLCPEHNKIWMRKLENGASVSYTEIVTGVRESWYKRKPQTAETDTIPAICSSSSTATTTAATATPSSSSS